MVSREKFNFYFQVSSQQNKNSQLFFYKFAFDPLSDNVHPVVLHFHIEFTALK